MKRASVGSGTSARPASLKKKNNKTPKASLIRRGLVLTKQQTHKSEHHLLPFSRDSRTQANARLNFLLDCGRRCLDNNKQQKMKRTHPPPSRPNLEIDHRHDLPNTHTHRHAEEAHIPRTQILPAHSSCRQEPVHTNRPPIKKRTRQHANARTERRFARAFSLKSRQHTNAKHETYTPTTRP